MGGLVQHSLGEAPAASDQPHTGNPDVSAAVAAGLLTAAACHHMAEASQMYPEQDPDRKADIARAAPRRSTEEVLPSTDSGTDEGDSVASTPLWCAGDGAACHGASLLDGLPEQQAR